MSLSITCYKYICPLPFMHVAFGANGDFRVCCNALHGKQQGHLKRADGKNYNIGIDKIGTHINAPLLKEIRKSMLHNRWHSECVRCMEEEQANLKSRRVTELASTEIFGEHFQTYIKGCDKSTGEIGPDFLPIDMDLRFGNKCNLRCRICSPAESDSWYSDYVKLHNTDRYSVPGGEVKLKDIGGGSIVAEEGVYNFIESDFFWKNIQQAAKTLKRIYIVGGEPLIIERHFKFLKDCITFNLSKNIILEYNSNLTCLTDEMIDLWRKFKRVDFGVSIDGVKEVHEYIRYPSRWDSVAKNLKKLNALCSEDKFNAWIATTISVFNIFYLKELVEWLFENELYNLMNFSSKKPILKMHMLKRPTYYSVQNLPEKMKKEVVEKLRDYINGDFIASMKKNSSKKCFTNFVSELDGAISFMEKKNQKSEFLKFLEVTKKLDNIRGQSMKTSLNDFSKIL